MSRLMRPFGVGNRSAASGAAFDRPRHIGIIMDGNGRWAAKHALPRSEGHRRGVEALRRAVRAAIELGIGTLTVYSFSMENWSRPADEVGMLMALLRRFIRNDLADLHNNNVRIRVIGTRDGLPSDIAPLLLEAEETTRRNDGLTLVVAFNYGGRQEIAAAARAIALDVAAGHLRASDVGEKDIEQRLSTFGLPDPDLVIRTSGEQRISNFLLWQGAYAEFVFLPVLWPDFDRASMEEAIAIYITRERRFGGRLGGSGQKTA